MEMAAIVVLFGILGFLIYARRSKATSQSGESRTAEPLMPQPKLDAGGNLDSDIACRKCDYNLHGLQPDGLCPECGTPVGLSTQGDLLRFADRAWVQELARGLNFNLWGLAVTTLAAKAGGVGGMIILPAGGLIAFYGAWLLTKPDPSGLDDNKYHMVRKVVRFALAVGLLWSFSPLIAMVAWVAALEMPFFQDYWFFMFLKTALIAAALVGLIGEFAKFSYLEMLAMRIPDRKLARRAFFIRWAFPILIAVPLVDALIRALRLGGIIGVGSFTMATVIVGFILLLVALHLHWCLGKTLREVASSARHSWPRGGG